MSNGLDLFLYIYIIKHYNINYCNRVGSRSLAVFMWNVWPSYYFRGRFLWGFLRGRGVFAALSFGGSKKASRIASLRGKSIPLEVYLRTLLKRLIMALWREL